MLGGQKPRRLLRLSSASARWRSVAVMNPLHAGDAYDDRERALIVWSCRQSVGGGDRPAAVGWRRREPAQRARYERTAAGGRIRRRTTGPAGAGRRR